MSGFHNGVAVFSGFSCRFMVSLVFNSSIYQVFSFLNVVLKVLIQFCWIFEELHQKKKSCPLKVV